MLLSGVGKTTLRVLLVQHSLSGETNTATHEFLNGFREGIKEDPLNLHLDVVEQQIETKPPFRFPWDFWAFFDVMSETVVPDARGKDMQHWTIKKPNLVSIGLVEEQTSSSTDQPGFDLIVFGWQTWFLSPSLPVRLAVNDPTYQKLLQKAPILLIGTHRNMWHRASRTLCRELKENAQSKVVGGINFVQSSAFLVSVVKTLRWQLKGEIDSSGATNAREQANTEGFNFAKRYAADHTWPENYQGGKPYSTSLAFLEDLWFPLKRAAALGMAMFPPESLYRRIITVLYLPLLLSAILILAPPVLFVGSILQLIEKEFSTYQGVILTKEN